MDTDRDMMTDYIEVEFTIMNNKFRIKSCDYGCDIYENGEYIHHITDVFNVAEKKTVWVGYAIEYIFKNKTPIKEETVV